MGFFPEIVQTTSKTPNISSSSAPRPSHEGVSSYATSPSGSSHSGGQWKSHETNGTTCSPSFMFLSRPVVVDSLSFLKSENTFENLDQPVGRSSGEVVTGWNKKWCKHFGCCFWTAEGIQKVHWLWTAPDAAPGRPFSGRSEDLGGNDQLIGVLGPNCACWNGLICQSILGLLVIIISKFSQKMLCVGTDYFDSIPKANFRKRDRILSSSCKQV